MRLFRRAEVWIPTRFGWLLVLGLPTLTAALVLVGVYSALTVNAPGGAGYLVVEGWMSRTQLKAAAAIYREGAYGAVLVTGGPIPEETFLKQLYPDKVSRSEIGVAQFTEMGISPVVAVSRPEVGKDRTYSSALGLRKWLLNVGDPNPSVDIVSSGPHSRRSWMLCEAALKDVATVGVIALEPIGYDPQRWWTTSTGVRSLISELIAYGYAKFLFYPNPEVDIEKLFPKEN